MKNNLDILSIVWKDVEQVKADLLEYEIMFSHITWFYESVDEITILLRKEDQYWLIKDLCAYIEGRNDPCLWVKEPITLPEIVERVNAEDYKQLKIIDQYITEDILEIEELKNYKSFI